MKIWNEGPEMVILGRPTPVPLGKIVTLQVKGYYSQNSNAPQEHVVGSEVFTKQIFDN